MSLTKIDDYFGILFYKDGCTYSTMRIVLYDAVDNVWKEREICAISTLNYHISSRKSGYYLKDFARRFLDYGTSPKDLFMSFNERFGVTVKRVVARLIFNINRHFIDPYKHYIDAYCRGWAGRIIPKKYITLMDTYSNIKAIEADGLDNIAIFGVLGMSTKELKVFFGKSNWKWLCGNSRTRNCLIVNSVTWLLSNTYEDKEFNKCAIRYLIDMCKGLRYCDIRGMRVSGVMIKYLTELNIQPKFMIEAMRFCSDVKYIYDIVKDTCSMASMLEEKYDVSKAKDFTTLRGKHDEFSVRLIKQRDMEDDSPFDYIHRFDLESFRHYSGDGKIYFEWIKSPNELRRVAEDQRHCVSGYIDGCKNGRYLVGVIRDSNTDKILSTIGYNVLIRYGSDISHTSMDICKDQHYAKCNTQPSLKCKELARIVEEEILPELVQRQHKLLQVA